MSIQNSPSAHRGFVPGRRRGGDLLSGHVFCGMCERRMAIEINGDGRSMYRCRHRGMGCRQPRRTNLGLIRAAVLGIDLLAHDENLQSAIRRKLAGEGRTGLGDYARRTSRRTPAKSLAHLTGKQRKLLDLYYRDKIGPEAFSEEESRIAEQIEAARSEAAQWGAQDSQRNDLASRFEQVAASLRDLDIKVVWSEATHDERRILIEELIEGVRIFPDHLQVNVAGAPPLNVLYQEVGLKESETAGVGGGT